MSSAELHSLISQLQGESDSELAYEADIGAPTFDVDKRFWVDDKNQRIPVPEGKHGPYVPHWNETKKYTDYDNKLIPNFNYKTVVLQTTEAKRNKWGGLDYIWYMRPENFSAMCAMLNWEIARSREMTTQHQNHIKKLKEQHTETKNGTSTAGDIFPQSITYVRSNNQKAHRSTAQKKTRTLEQEAQYQVALAAKKARHADGIYSEKEKKNYARALELKERKKADR